MAAFYRRFETEVIAAEACGVSFVNETILQDEIETIMNDLKVEALKQFKENSKGHHFATGCARDVEG